jgi:ABC-2 type transport system permease protein
VRAIVGKELRDYRRNRFVVASMSVLPIVFVALPMIQLFKLNVSASSSQLDLHIGLSLLYLLAIPTFIPSALAAYSVVGEREQGTLEPILTTPIHRQEFLIGKALAAFIPTIVVAYAIFGIFLASAAIFAAPAIASAVFEGSHLLTQLLFTPLLAGWSIWVGIAVSTRVRDVRAAQQLGVLASLPPLVIVALLSLGVIPPSLGLALGLAAALLVFDGLDWRAVAGMFDRERLITGQK